MSLPKIIAETLRIFGILAFGTIGIILALISVKLIAGMFISTFSTDVNLEHILEEAFLIFLFLEVIAAIKIYFSQNFHFPLRFFFYIAMTDLIRHIIIARHEPKHALILSAALLITSIAFGILEIKSQYLRTQQNKPFSSDEERLEL